MRVLLIHAEDSPRRGPWTAERWDLIVDLGKSSNFSSTEWQALARTAVLRADSFRHGVDDVLQTRHLFSSCRGRLVDEEGIDWWDLMSLVVAPEAQELLTLRRLARELNGTTELWATRRDWSVDFLAGLVRLHAHSFERSLPRPIAAGVRYGKALRRFRAAQLREIVLDKWDPALRWRARFAGRAGRFDRPIVLVPSAYTNVSRMAAAYASLIPDTQFLLLATRQSAKQFDAPSNVQVRDLAAYAIANSVESEIEALQKRWLQLRGEFERASDLCALASAGVMNSFPGWIRSGVAVRNAWREALTREPVCGVFCGDDSNLFTRVPVLLAARRKIPTVDFHHGALDGRYLLKDLPSDLYLAKGEMERDYLTRRCGMPSKKIVVGAPPQETRPPTRARDAADRGSAILFSEPYELARMRAEEVYREVLPALCRIAKENNRGVIVKLHPFESCAQRSKMVRACLEPAEQQLVRVIDGPLTSELLSQAWFGITVESTTVIDCLLSGVRCFLCGWLSLSPYEYAAQYARFGVGETLESALQIGEIPQRLAKPSKTIAAADLWPTASKASLRQWLAGTSQTRDARPVS